MLLSISLPEYGNGILEEVVNLLFAAEIIAYQLFRLLVGLQAAVQIDQANPCVLLFRRPIEQKLQDIRLSASAATLNQVTEGLIKIDPTDRGIRCQIPQRQPSPRLRKLRIGIALPKGFQGRLLRNLRNPSCPPSLPAFRLFQADSFDSGSKLIGIRGLEGQGRLKLQNPVAASAKPPTLSILLRQNLDPRGMQHLRVFELIAHFQRNHGLHIVSYPAWQLRGSEACCRHHEKDAVA